MHLVMGVSDHILVLDYGRRLAEGTAERGAPRPAGDRGLSRCRRGMRTTARRARRSMLEVASCRAATGAFRRSPASSLARRAGRAGRPRRRQRRRQDDAAARHLRRPAGEQRHGPVRRRRRDARRRRGAASQLGIVQVPEGRQVFGRHARRGQPALGAFARPRSARWRPVSSASTRSSRCSRRSAARPPARSRAGSSRCSRSAAP